MTVNPKLAMETEHIPSKLREMAFLGPAALEVEKKMEARLDFDVKLSGSDREPFHLEERKLGPQDFQSLRITATSLSKVAESGGGVFGRWRKKLLSSSGISVHSFFDFEMLLRLPLSDFSNNGSSSSPVEGSQTKN